MMNTMLLNYYYHIYSPEFDEPKYLEQMHEKNA